MRRLALVVLLALGLVAGSGGSAVAEAKVCRHDMYLRSGIGPVRVEHVSCRRAIGTLRTWVWRGMPKPGPRGWRCRMRRIGDEAPYIKARCARARARMRFEIGG